MCHFGLQQLEVRHFIANSPLGKCNSVRKPSQWKHSPSYTKRIYFPETGILYLQILRWI